MSPPTKDEGGTWRDDVKAVPLLFSEQHCPGIGREWIGNVLAEMRDDGKVACQGRGPAARWWNAASKLRRSKGTTSK